MSFSPKFQRHVVSSAIITLPDIHTYPQHAPVPEVTSVHDSIIWLNKYKSEVECATLIYFIDTSF